MNPTINLPTCQHRANAILMARVKELETELRRKDATIAQLRQPEARR